MKSNIIVPLKGRLGNHFFQIFFAQIISKKSNSNFCIQLSKNHTIPEISKMCCIEKISKNTPGLLRINEMCIEENTPYKFVFNNEVYDWKIESIVDIINSHPENNFNIVGFFQNYKFYTEYTDEMKKFISNTEGFRKNKFNFGTNSAGIQIRKGDIQGRTPDLPDNWYLSFAERYKHLQLYITTDSPESYICNKLINDYGAIFVGEGGLGLIDPLEQMAAISNCNYLCLSQGTFAYWCGFMSNNKVFNIVAKNGWNTNNPIKAHLIDPKFKWIHEEDVCPDSFD